MQSEPLAMFAPIISTHKHNILLRLSVISWIFQSMNLIGDDASLKFELIMSSSGPEAALRKKHCWRRALRLLCKCEFPVCERSVSGIPSCLCVNTCRHHRWSALWNWKENCWRLRAKTLIFRMIPLMALCTLLQRFMQFLFILFACQVMAL